MLYGIEPNINVAKISEKIIETITQDFEENYTMNFKESKTNFFDYIIIGNKLQFSKDPWKLLTELKNI